MIFKIPASNGSNGIGSKGNAYAVPERKIVDMIWVTKVIFKWIILFGILLLPYFMIL